MGQLGEAFKRAPRPDPYKLMKAEKDRPDPRTHLEGPELAEKLHKSQQRQEEFYDKLIQVLRSVLCALCIVFPSG